MRLRETPVPIPNTTVKPQPADGTMLETAWESRWMPDFCGGVAQLGEHLPCKQGVKSSNLSISTRRTRPNGSGRQINSRMYVAVRKLRFLTRVQARYKNKIRQPLKKASFLRGRANFIFAPYLENRILKEI